MRIAIHLWLGVLVCQTAVAETNSESLQRLFKDHFDWRLKEFPEVAMSRGIYDHADRITDNSLVAVERRYQQTKQFLNRLEAIDKSQLGATEQVNYELFDWLLNRNIREHEFKSHLAPIGPRSGPHQRIAQMHERVRFDRLEDYENYLARLELVPESINNTIKALDIGMSEGIMPPRISMQGVPQQFDALLNGGLLALSEPFNHFPESIGTEDRQRVIARFNEASFPKLEEAMKSLASFIVNQYIPKCRESVAAVDLPNGQAYYAFQLQKYTTTDLGAAQIHEIGLKEVARLRKEMMTVIRRSDYITRYPDRATLDDEQLFKSFLIYLRTDSRFYHQSEEALLAGYRDICKRVDGEMPKYFGHLPRLPYGVRKIPDFMAPTQTTAYYQHGDIDNAQAGYFYANTYRLDQRPKYEMVALAMHEAVPGHHLQVAIAQEMETVPEFRKDIWFTAFGEGWALYSERLGIEMGLYEDPYDDFGRLLYEMWRACRLVVDPGMHALGWSRDQAIQFMMDNTALSELNIKNEIDRYIYWPGQATAYKIGELMITEMRRRAERDLQEKFDIRGFHDCILEMGSIPLHLLEQRLGTWIESRG